MKKLNKKGFTIVELVIVIAVIAILAAVLIPTFSGVVQKANVSADTQAARNAYTQYVAAQDANAIGSATTATYIYKGSNYFVYIEDQAVVDVNTETNAIANCPTTIDTFNTSTTETEGYLKVADKLYQKITITPVVKYTEATAKTQNATLDGALKVGDKLTSANLSAFNTAQGSGYTAKVLSDEDSNSETEDTCTLTETDADAIAKYNASLVNAVKEGDVKTAATYVIAD